MADGTLLGSWTIDAANSKPSGITNDPSGSSTSLWIVDSGSDQVFEYDNGLAHSGGSLTNVFALATANSNPQGIADPLPTNRLIGRSALITTPLTLDPRGVLPSIQIASANAISVDSNMVALAQAPRSKIGWMTDFREHRQPLNRYREMPSANGADGVFADPDFHALEELGISDGEVDDSGRSLVGDREST